MTKEDKQLLLKDLSARLSYGVICDCQHDYHATASAVDAHDLTVYYYYCDEWESIEYCKPYLRPMSSMTEEEKEELKKLFDAEEVTSDSICYLEGGTLVEYLSRIPYSFCCEIIDWLNKNMFDYRGLIPKGLAIEVIEENNPYKTLKL